MNNNTWNRESVLETAVNLPYFDNEFTETSSRMSDSVVEDDGMLHVNLGGVHVVFYVGQDASRRELNEVGTEIARAYGLTFRL